MRHDQPAAVAHHAETAQPRWSALLIAIREARSVTQDGWATRLGVSRRTVQRWERGDWPPDTDVESGILAYCAEKGLFHTFDRGPLAQFRLTAESLRALLEEARTLAGRRAAGRDGAGRAPDRRQAPTPDDTPPGAAAAARSVGLPAPLTSFVGRERELADVRRTLGGTRLLTLAGAGAGGCGKTRLALALAEELVWAYPHGVCFVELAALAEPALLPQTVASALGLWTAGPQPVGKLLVEHLAQRHLLLVLDNCEHLLPACAALVESLLRACPHLEVLTTSREPLGMGGETLWRVPPMTVPSSEFLVPSWREHQEPGTRNRELEQADAVRLFVERARQYRPEFALTDANAAAIVRICARLDGMPLALELAAACVRVLSVEQIAARLDDRFRLLTGGSRTALPRQQTLRETLDWSYDLLTPPEQAVLCRLSVFAGGWSLEAAEAVCRGVGAAGDSAVVSAADVLDLLTHLVDKSLVIAEERGARSGSDGVRYRMLETVRQYTSEKLTATGDVRATREQHAQSCLAFAEAAESHRTGPEQDMWLARLTVEHDNLRAALGWCLSDDDGVAAGLRLGGALWWFWEVRGHYSEGRRWLAALLGRGGQTPPDVRAKALSRAGMLAQMQGDYDESERLHEQSLALWSELGDDVGLASSLNSLGVLAGMRGDHARGRALLEESLALERKRGERERIAISLMNLGIAARQQGESDRAVAFYEESLALQRELGNTRGVATTLQNLGNVLQDEGAPERAAARFREGLSLFLELEDRLGAARCLGGLATVAITRGDAKRAARLGGAAAALRAAIAVPLPLASRARFERTTAAARAALGEAEFTAAWAAGEALSLEEASASALAD